MLFASLFEWDGLLDLIQILIVRGQLTAFVVGIGASFLVWLRWLRPNASGVVARWQTKLDEKQREVDELHKTSVLLRATDEAHEAERSRLRETIDELTRECERVHADRAELDDEHRRLLARALTLDAEVESVKEQVRDLIGQVRELTEQIQVIADFDGKIWERPVIEPVVAFRPLAARRVPIVSVVNLKGGVGKTTLTANLGATLWNQGRRVLLLDLDYQSSLTSLCFSDQEIGDLRIGQRYVQEFFREGGGTPNNLLGRAKRIGESCGFLVAADEQLTDVETQEMARWLLGLTPDDVRFRLRHALHSPEVPRHYDWVLIDCPPRLTTACINALASSDYVLIPVLLDQTSAEAVPRLLRWLRGLKQQVCPELKVLGVVGNRAYPRLNLVGREENVWKELPGKCMDAWGEPIYLFKTIIRDNGKFAEAARANRFAAFDASLQPVFTALTQEIIERMPSHESSRPAIVH